MIGKKFKSNLLEIFQRKKKNTAGRDKKKENNKKSLRYIVLLYCYYFACIKRNEMSLSHVNTYVVTAIV